MKPYITDVMACAEALSACLCEQLATGPDLCFCGVLPGAEVAIDVGSCQKAEGMAYVRVTSIYPSVSVGVAYVQPGNCQAGVGFDLELGVYRPYPLDRNGGSPPADVILAKTRQQMADAQSMSRALACCDWLPATDFIRGTYAPAGPAGGILGGIVPVSAWVA